MERKLKNNYLKVKTKIVMKDDQIWRNLLESDVIKVSQDNSPDSDKIVMYELVEVCKVFGFFTEKCKITAVSLSKLAQKTI